MASREVHAEDPAPEVLRLVVGEELDLERGQALIEAIRHGLRDRPEQVVVDARAVEFADSTGLAALVRCRRMCAATGASFAVEVAEGTALDELLVQSGTGEVLGAQRRG